MTTYEQFQSDLNKVNEEIVRRKERRAATLEEAMEDAPDLYVTGTKYALVLLGASGERFTKTAVVVDGAAVNQIIDQWHNGETITIPVVDTTAHAKPGRWRHLRCDRIVEIRTAPGVLWSEL